MTEPRTRSNKPTRTLTLEIEVPADQVPENATGRLVWALPNNDCLVAMGRTYGRWEIVPNPNTGTFQLIIETREPWKVPEHLRHSIYNGWTMDMSANPRSVFVYNSGGWECPVMEAGKLEICPMSTVLGFTSESDFDGMEPGKVYKLGEGTE